MGIESLPNPRAAKFWCNQIRARGLQLGFVATMGALHRGHLALVERARRENDAVCASIFVNPLQFDNRADLENYPRDFERDVGLLDGVGCAMVFRGEVQDFFPEAKSIDDVEMRTAGAVANGLEGEYRHRHLDGVLTIVEKLFGVVGGCNAYFGEKDFQQTLVVGAAAREFDDINIVVCDTLREESGLAYSSRNARLNKSQRDAATRIYKSLCSARNAFGDGVREVAELEKIMRSELQHPLIKIQYAKVRDGDNWNAMLDLNIATAPRALVAVQIGEVRLIDNLSLGDCA